MFSSFTFSFHCMALRYILYHASLSPKSTCLAQFPTSLSYINTLLHRLVTYSEQGGMLSAYLLKRFTVQMQEIGSEMSNTTAGNENPFSICFHKPIIKNGSSGFGCAVYVFLCNESCS